MPLTRLEEFLNRERVNYKRILHCRSFTAQKTAAYAHISGNTVAKTVIVKIDGRMAMAVIPASMQLNLKALKEATGADDVRLAFETEFKDEFNDCEVGAMPPFGNLYKMEVFVADSLGRDSMIAFNACNHVELIQMNFRDYHRLVRPAIVKMCRMEMAEP